MCVGGGAGDVAGGQLAQGALWAGWEQRAGKLYRSMDRVRDRFGFDSLAVGRTLPAGNTE